MLSLFAWFPFYADCVSFPVFSPCWKEAARTASIAERQSMPLEDAVLCLLWNVGTLQSGSTALHHAKLSSCHLLCTWSLYADPCVYHIRIPIRFSFWRLLSLTFLLFFSSILLCQALFCSWRYIAHTYFPQSSLRLLYPFNLHSCCSRQLWG